MLSAASRRRQPSPRQRVLFVNTATRPPLGADMWIHAEILAHLDRARVELHAACDPGRPGAPTPTAQALAAIPDLEVVPVRLGTERRSRTLGGMVRWLLGAGEAFTGLCRLAWYARRHRIEIVHCADRPRDALVCVLLARLIGAKSVIHAHVAYGDWMSPLLTWALRHADALVGVSAFVAETLVASGRDPKRVHVVLNGIDVSRWTPGAGRDAARAELDVGPEAPVVLTICRLFPEKGPAALIEAMAVVTQHHPDARLLIVGQEMVPGYADALVRLAEQLDVAAHVDLLGRRSDVEALLAACDIFAMPSLAEPFGLVFVEAMAMQVPVVALDSGGAPEVILDDATGLLSEPGDQVGLAKHLLELMADPSQRARLGEAGRRRAEGSFTSQRMADDMAAVYERVGPAGL